MCLLSFLFSYVATKRSLSRSTETQEEKYREKKVKEKEVLYQVLITDD